MTDKENILAEIERLKNKLNYEPFTDEVLGKRNALNSILSFIDTLPEEPVSNPTPNERMSKERFAEACKAACNDRNYRSHHGHTETRDDYFVDGVQWSDEHPALTWEDMMHIHKHLKDAMNLYLYELQNGIEGQKKVYQNVLDRFLKERNKED